MSDISVVDVSGTLDREMAPSWKKVVARRDTWSVATAQVGCTTKHPDARRNGRTQELRDSSSRARGAQRWRFWLKKCQD